MTSHDSNGRRGGGALHATAGHELPRELAPGLFWLGECEQHPPRDGRILHTYSSMFVLCGDKRSVLVDCGPAAHLPAIERQLDGLIASGRVPPVEYLFPTHTETPHSAGLGLWMEKFPQALVVGDTRDYHLFFELDERRLRRKEAGDRIDLGGRHLTFIEPVIYDLKATLWGYEADTGALFAGDGFAYGHDHDVGQCGCLAEEVPQLPFGDLVAEFTERALYWMIFTDMEPYIEQLRRLVEDRQIKVVCNTHGLPITDLNSILPLLYDGFRQASHVKGARA